MTEATRTTSLVARAIIFATAIVAALTTVLLMAVRTALAAPTGPEGSVALDPQLASWAFASAALSAGLGALAAGYAVARVGSAAVGAIAEKPELFGRVLILVGLAEGIAIYGLIISVLILNRVGPA